MSFSREYMIKYIILPALPAALMALAVGCVLDGADAVGVDIERSDNPIIDGTLERGYPGVGGFLTSSGDMGGICTGTVVAAGWVLTAAHCVHEHDTWEVNFCLDADLTPILDGETTGDCYSARAIHVYSGYDPDSLMGDIALVEVRGLSGRDAYTYNTDSISGFTGRTVTWVGYGLNRVRPTESGDGIKRRGSGRIASLDWGHVYYRDEPHMPCRGDSGGPAFSRIGGEDRIVGVVSAGDESCNSSGTDTRVDAYASWITATLAREPTPDCGITGGNCGRQTCWPVGDGFGCFPGDGIREGSACNPNQEDWDNLPCADGSICMQISDDPAAGECLAFCLSERDCADGEECYSPIFESVADVGVCIPAPTTCDILGGDCPSGEACYPTVDEEFYCFPSSSIAEGSACDPDTPISENLPCGDGTICIEMTSDEGLCLGFCRGTGDCASGDECHIPIFRDIDDIGICIPGEECIDEDYDDYCAGHDCDDNNRDTFPGATERCGDGRDNDCDGAIDEDCGCVDGDGDGFCDGNDCNDGDAAIHPGAAEACADGLDNNCDGAVDEGCECIDADLDGFCAGIDCDDLNNTINPGFAENCADGWDNDCDGFVDAADDQCGSTDDGGGGSSKGCHITAPSVSSRIGDSLIDLLRF